MTKKLLKIKATIEADFGCNIEELEYYNDLPVGVFLSTGMESRVGISFIANGKQYYGRVVLIFHFWMGGILYYKMNSKGKITKVDIRNI